MKLAARLGLGATAVVVAMAACGGTTVNFSNSGTGGGGGEGGQTATSTSTTTMVGPKCGNGNCEPGENKQSCPADCGYACGHDPCEVGDPLDQQCDPCVAQVCAADPYCCEGGWDSQCIGGADQLCNAGCCGNGQCQGQTCDTCPADCGECVCGDNKCEGESCETCADDCGVCPTCVHSVCDTGDALTGEICRDPCVAEVCQQNPACCSEDESPVWSVACQKIAVQSCGGDGCVAKVCETLPACCSKTWNSVCVDQAKQVCGSGCDCSHEMCDAGDPLKKECDPCVAQICLTDPYCCDAAWDGICVAEVGSVCGVACK